MEKEVFMQKNNFCMNMNKNGKFRLSKLAKRVLHSGLLMIYASLIALILSLPCAPLGESEVRYFGRLLEYPVAALTLLTALTLLAERIYRDEKK